MQSRELPFDDGSRSRSGCQRCLSVLLAGSLLAQVSHGQQFGPGQPVTYSADSLRAIGAADLDGDGDPDALSASAGDGKIAWYENADGLGSFWPQRIITDEAQDARSVLAADLDGDGDHDVLCAFGDDKIAWHRNVDGLATFGPAQVITNKAEAIRSVHVADLDGDGDPDVLSASSIENKIAWYENADGQGSFGAPRIITTAALAAQSVFAADFDGDGDQDVFSASYVDDKIAWYANTDGLGNFGPPLVVTDKANGAQQVIAADLDGDGDQDVLSRSVLDDRVRWFENADGLGGTGHPQVITKGADGSIATADLDGDGDRDVLAGGGVHLGWFENTDGLGKFGTHQPIAPGKAELVFAADLDGDGDQDALSGTWLEMAWHENNDGLAAFGPPQAITNIAWGAASGFAADLDGDGDQDVLSASDEDHKIAWYENTDGEGTFGPQQVITDQALGARAVVAADLDGDGDQDILSAAYDKDEIAWFRNVDGTGNFALQQTGHLQEPGSVFAADLDGDGDQDILAASTSSVTHKVVWYENGDGLGTFGTQQFITTDILVARSIFAADLDGDGDQDVLSTSSKKVAWYENVDGLGTFGPQLQLTAAVDQPGAVVAADLDGDGDLDVVATGDSQVFWFRNSDGLGDFGHLQVIADGTGGSAFAADLDGDGDQDVLATSVPSGKIAWFENTDGLGNFGPTELVTATAGCGGVFAADLNGDGHPEALSVSPCHEGIAWYENLQVPLTADTDTLSLSTGGVQRFTLEAGVEHGLLAYLLLGTLAGTEPGLPIDGLLLPLNPDSYTTAALLAPNTAPLASSLGTLDAQGVACASFTLPPGLPPGLSGLTLHHAFVVIELLPTLLQVVLASNAVPLTLAP